MTFYTEKFNGVDEDADKPSQPSQWDSLKDVPYMGPHDPFDKNPDDMQGWDEPKNTPYMGYGDSIDRLSADELQAMGDMEKKAMDARNRVPYMGYGDSIDRLSADELQAMGDMEKSEMERIQREKEKREELHEGLSSEIDEIKTNYVENRTDLPGRKEVEQGDPIYGSTAKEKMLSSKSAKELEKYLDVIENDPYALEDLFYEGFGIAKKARGEIYDWRDPDNDKFSKPLDEKTTEELKNFVSLFASLVERGVRIPQEFEEKVWFNGKGEDPLLGQYLTLDVVMDEIAEMVDEKGSGDKLIDNPINELTGANGEEKISAKKLTDLALKARANKKKLSADTINFPA